jgi:hypothetical protein
VLSPTLEMEVRCARCVSVVKQDTGECRQDSTVPARSRVVHPDSLVGLCGVSVGVKQETVGVPTRHSESSPGIR